MVDIQKDTPNKDEPKKNSFTTPLSRKEILISLLIGVFGIILAVVFDKPETIQLPEQQTIQSQPSNISVTKQSEPNTIASQPARYFDYAKIVSVIGSQFKDRETDETGERWVNESLASIIRLDGAPDKITRITLVQPGKSTAEVINKNLLITHSLIAISTGISIDDFSVVNWIAQQEDFFVNATKVVNGVTINVIRLRMGNTYAWSITFSI
jgi:hypothetical protein